MAMHWTTRTHSGVSYFGPDRQGVKIKTLVNGEQMAVHILIDGKGHAKNSHYFTDLRKGLNFSYRVARMMLDYNAMIERVEK